MTVIDLLSRLREREVELADVDGRLRVRAPEGALTAELHAELARRKGEVLEVLRRARGPAAPSTAAARPRDLPLSYAQERFWFLEQLERGTSAYHLLFGIQFTGLLNVGAVHESLRGIVRRHEALRTSFLEEGGRPRQVVAEGVSVPLPIIDLQHLPETIRNDGARRRALEVSQQPFDLGRAPLMRNVLVRLAPEEHLLVFVLHHIVSDGWSVGVIIREFGALYDAASSGRDATLTELPRQYVDFAIEQRDSFAAGRFTAQRDYWKLQLSGVSPLEMPSDRPRPQVLSVRGGETTFAIDRAMSEELILLSNREGVTPFMTLFAAFQVLLHRYSGQDDIATGTAIAGRTTGEYEQVVGPFINTLVLRTRFAGAPTFREVLQQVRATALDAYGNQDLPFEKLVDELQPQRDLSRNPLCQVIFALQNVPAADIRLEGLTLGLVPFERVTAALDMDWMVFPTHEGLRGTVRYSSDLFDRETVDRMTRHYVSVLRGAIGAPDTAIAALPLLDEREEKLVTADWNDTARAYPADAGIAKLFEAQVERRPDAIAIATDSEQLTYGELNRRANRLAHLLAALGVGPDALVGVFQERSAEAVVSLVAILKAGGAYLPLDPAYPQARLTLMLEDARPLVVLTTCDLRDRLPESQARVLCLDAEADRLAARPDTNPASLATPEHLAYVTYTSGSTGLPKGVEVRQRGVTRLLFGAEYVRIDENDCFLQLASISFDASTFEVWGALLHGARLAILGESVPTPAALGEALDRHKVSILWLTASFFNAVVDTHPGVLAGVRQLLTGGEALSVAHVRRAQAALPRTRIINGYGPTESTTFACCHPIAPLPDEGIASIPIGRPISNTTVYVLDATGRPAPVGVPGELYIGGDGLARGYLNRPSLTAERFVPDPFGARPGARLYRTGDIVRYSRDGLIQFLGRNDDQVKIRGFRVEPGEVEQVLRDHPAVREAAVIVQEQSAASRRLVAYVVPVSGSAGEPFVDDVRQFAQRKLPAHMVPAAFVELEDLPLTTHGKLDRRALPDPEPVRRQASPAAAPRTSAERSLAEIWGRVLRIEQVGVHENFFELGGDSILSLQVVAGARAAGLGITPRQIFEHPTVAELARVADAKARGSATSAPSESADGDVPLTPVQHWFFEQALERPEHFNHAVLLALRERPDPSHVRDALAHVVAWHDALRLRFSANGDKAWCQSYVPLGSVPAPRLSVVDLSTAPPDAQRAGIEQHAAELHRSLDLAAGAIVQAALFDLGAQGSRLLLIVHHLAIDGVSWRILVGDLQKAYTQLRDGQHPQLAPKTTSFQTWARRLTRYAASLQGEVSYWASLADVPVASCPIDHPQGTNTYGSVRTIDAWLTAGETRSLLQDVARLYGMRIHEALLTALAGTFTEWTNHPSLLLDVEGHGRESIFDDVDLSSTVGWFTTIYPLSLTLERARTVKDQLTRVKEQFRRVPGQGLGYGVLRYLSTDPSVRRQLSAIPSAEIGFNYLGQFDDLFAAGFFSPASEPAGPLQDPGSLRPHVLEISARVVGGRLHVAWNYSANLHDESTVERLAGRFLERVRDVVAHCGSGDAGAYTPSDFPEAKVSQDQLDRLMTKLKAGGKR